MPKTDKKKKQKPTRRHRLAAALCFLIPAALLVLFYLFRDNQEVMNGIIAYVSTPIKRAVSWLCDFCPLSIAEIIWTAAILAAVLFIISTIVRLILRPHRLRFLFRRLYIALCALLIVYCGYTLMWGVNYYGDSFSELADLTPRGATKDELYQLSCSFAKYASDASSQVSRDAEGYFTVDTATILERGCSAYTGIAKEYTFLNAPSRRAKPMIESPLISRIGFTGFFFPFTGEANVNTDQTDIFLPVVTLHELAHQRNVATEDAANFVAIMAGLRSGQPDYMYSAAVFGFLHLSNALYTVDRSLWKECWTYANEDVRRDMARNDEYWAKFKTEKVSQAAEQAAKQVYSDVAESYGEEDIMGRYGECVELLVSYYFDRKSA